jgi:membrane associated rhomboid family serine protease
VPGISLAAHVGGFVAGAAYAAASTLPARSRPRLVSAVVLLALVGLVAFVVTSMDPGQLSS